MWPASRPSALDGLASECVDPFVFGMPGAWYPVRMSNSTLYFRQLLAGEDIARGDYITVLSEIIEAPSFLWDCSGLSIPFDEPVRTRYLPNSAGGPHKVVAVCLPFVYAERPRGAMIAFDTRQQQLVRIDHAIGRLLWKRMQKAKKKN